MCLSCTTTQQKIIVKGRKENVADASTTALEMTPVMKAISLFTAFAVNVEKSNDAILLVLLWPFNWESYAHWLKRMDP